jgi:polyisoprenoid-binding protein YceI
MRQTGFAWTGAAFAAALLLTSAVVPHAVAADGAARAAKITDPAAVPAGSYRLDKNHSSVTGMIDRQGLSRYAFRFQKIDASFTYDPANPEAAKVEVVLDPLSLDSNSPPIDGHLRSNEFLDPMKFPEIKFVSTAIRRTGGNKGTMTGNLSFIGFTRPVTLDVTFNGAMAGRRTTMGFSATGVIKISDFGPVGVMFEKEHMLGDDVPIAIEVLFDKAA